LDSAVSTAYNCDNRASCTSVGFATPSYQQALSSCRDPATITRSGTLFDHTTPLIDTTTASEIAARLQETFAAPTPLLTGAEDVGDRLAVLPALFHLMWRQELVADLAHERLGPTTLVRAVGPAGGS
jgi:hypothetical protein